MLWQNMGEINQVPMKIFPIFAVCLFLFLGRSERFHINEKHNNYFGWLHIFN